METIQNSLKRNFNLYLKAGLSFISLVFFIANYHICNYFYPLTDDNSIENWWLLKLDIYAVIIAMCYIIASLESSKNSRIKFIEKLIVAVGIGFAISNFIDRRFLNDTKFHVVDFVVLSFIVFVSYVDLKYIKKMASKFTPRND